MFNGSCEYHRVDSRFPWGEGPENKPRSYPKSYPKYIYFVIQSLGIDLYSISVTHFIS